MSMIDVYVNYPNPHITIHADSSCGNIQQHHKRSQRVIKITHGSLSRELLKFAAGDYKFAPNAELNDMWLEVDLEDSKFEHSVVDHIWVLLAKKYSPFRSIKIDEHCQP
ncbi:MAG: hypothetical protein HQ498_12150 [Pseudohongiella sp.]|nr:hypothetical protein [Pseudohongiella sp.]